MLNVAEPGSPMPKKKGGDAYLETRKNNIEEGKKKDQ